MMLGPVLGSAPPPVGSNIISEASDQLITEAGDTIITE